LPILLVESIAGRYEKIMKILLTGGAGYIGSHTAVELFEAGHEPVIVDDFSNSEKWIIDRIEQIIGAKPKVYEGDCTDRNFLNEVFEKEKDIEGIIHFAASKAVGESIEKPLVYYRNNINSLLSVLEVMQEYDVQNIVFSSSATVYGNPDVNPLTENSPRKPATCPYGNTKAICEDILQDWNQSAAHSSAIILRYFNPIGAHNSHLIGELPLGIPDNLVPYITQTAAGIREKLTIFGNDYTTPDGTCIRDFIHVSDLAKAHICALEHATQQTPSYIDTFNVGTGHGTSVMELIKIFEKVNNLKLNYTIGKRRSGDVPECWADVSKIDTTLGWKAQYTLQDALKDAWEWQKTLSQVK